MGKDFKAVYTGPTLTIDYSENIALAPKREVQSAHFSGKQQTLHCCVMEKQEGNTYIHHLSDDTRRDCIMSFEVLTNIIYHYPEVISNGKLVIRSDNCSSQFKSKYVFSLMRQLAIAKQISIFWFYGEHGHGRGLVDSMSHFGCKGPLRYQITSTDAWFETAEEMLEYLKLHFENDDSKSYFCVDEKVLADIRKKPRDEYKIEGCLKIHMISVNKNGDFTTRNILKTDENLLLLDTENLENEEEAMFSIFNNEHDFDDGNNADSDVIDSDVLITFIETGTCIGLRSPPSSFELFYIVKVVSKEVAAENIVDCHSHAVTTGEEYVRGFYLEKVGETKKIIKFKELKDYVYVHLAEIFLTNIEVADNNMSISEYRSICQELY